MMRQTRSKDPLIITKANSRSTVHRHSYLDYIGVKVYDSQGNPAGEKRFIGLFTSIAYSESPRNIPLLRLKVQRVLKHFVYFVFEQFEMMLVGLTVDHETNI